MDEPVVQVSDRAVSDLKVRLVAAGFDAVRFASLEDPAPGAAELRSWLELGHHAGMDWMPRSLEKRLDPQLVLPEARSIILLGVNYGVRESTVKSGDSASVEEGQAPLWARYARYEDYHDTIKVGLEHAGAILETALGIGPEDYRYYVDTGPVLERGWAARAGLGFVGRNGMLVSPDFGNWLFLCAILVRAVLPPDKPFGSGRFAAGCGKCTRCLEACPTQALVAPGVVDARRCISYLTIEHKGAIPEEFREAIGGRIYGCDICAEVCPWNRFARESRSLLLAARTDFLGMPLVELLSLGPETFAALFRRTPVKRLKLERLLRNACVAAGNARDPSLRAPLVRLRDQASPLVREHAVWALGRLDEEDIVRSEGVGGSPSAKPPAACGGDPLQAGQDAAPAAG